MSDFSGKQILIVGGSSGIGLSLARFLGEAGAELFIASRTKPEGLTSSFTHIPYDVLDENSTLEGLPDSLHGLAYCPGSITLKPFISLSPEQYLKDFQLNTLGAIRVLKAAHKALRKAKGASIVLFSTVAVKQGMNFHTSVAAAKGALEGFGRSLAAEWAKQQVRVNLVAPSLTDTPLAESLLKSDEQREASAKRHPMGRIGQPDDIARAAAFLLSEESSWVTGQVMGVDGGLSSLNII